MGPVASMAALAEITVIEGNLGDAAPFTIRLKLSAGYDVLPHVVLGARPRVAFALPEGFSMRAAL